MRIRTMYVVAAGTYLLFVAALVLVIIFSRDQDSMLMGSAMLSSALMVVTLILAVIFMKNSPSERYKELYTKKEDEGPEKK